MINSICCIHSKIMPELVNGSSKNMLAQALLPLLVFEHGFIRYVLNFFCFCFISNKYFLTLLNFTRYLFSANTIFLLMRNIRNECWILKQKYFRKVFHVSWNDPETVFHEILWKKNFTAYLSLKNTYFEKHQWKPVYENLHFRQFANFVILSNLILNLLWQSGSILNKDESLDECRRG